MPHKVAEKRKTWKMLKKNTYDTFTIQKDPQTIFCLFFFTPHIRGFEKMLETKWRMDEVAGAGWHFSETMGESLFEKPDPQILRLEKALEEQLSIGSLTNVDLYLLSLRSGFLPKHMRDILNAFQKAGRIKVLPETTRKGAFYINYENFRDNSRKIEISKTK